MKASYANARTYYACHSDKGCRYPNSAVRKRFLERLVEVALAAAITVSAVVILLCMLILF